jgi:hypothetical protein
LCLAHPVAWCREVSSGVGVRTGGDQRHERQRRQQQGYDVSDASAKHNIPIRTRRLQHDYHGVRRSTSPLMKR